MVKNLLKNGRNIFSRQQSNILSAAAVITLASFLSAIFGLIKTRLLLTHFSATPQLQAILDSYWVALRLPELVFQLLVIGAVSAAFIPVFSRYMRKSKAEADRVASSVINSVLLIFILFSIIIFIFAREFIGLITSVQFTSEQITLAANLSRIMIFAQLLFAVSNFFTGIIQSQHRFLIPALSPVAYNLGIIAGIVFLTPYIGIYGAALGVLLGALLHLLLQLPLIIKLGFVYRPIISLRHKGVREMFKLMPPRVLAISVTQLELSATVFFSTALSAGSLTVMQIAQQLILTPIRMIAVPISQASLPFLSQETATGKLEKFKQTFTNSFHQILYLAFPAGILLLILRVPLVRIVYGSRQFPWEATLLTAKTVAVLSLSLFAQGAVHILSRAFYSLRNTKIPFLSAAASVVINIVLAYLSVFKFNLGVVGLAASLAVASIVQATLLLLFLSRQIGGFSLSRLLLSPLKMVVASAAMAVSLWLPMRLLDQFVLDTTRTIDLIILTLVASFTGMLVYLGFSRALNISQLKDFLSLLKRMGQWRQVLKQSDEVIDPASSAQEVKPT